METATKKRGRPSVEIREYGEAGPRLKAIVKESYETYSHRDTTNKLYMLEGFSIAAACNLAEAFNGAGGKIKGTCVLEQIGRMSLQNHYSEEICKEILTLSVGMMQNGWSIRAIEKYIRHGRNTGEW